MAHVRKVAVVVLGAAARSAHHHPPALCCQLESHCGPQKRRRTPRPDRRRAGCRGSVCAAAATAATAAGAPVPPPRQAGTACAAPPRAPSGRGSLTPRQRVPLGGLGQLPRQRRPRSASRPASRSPAAATSSQPRGRRHGPTPSLARAQPPKAPAPRVLQFRDCCTRCEGWQRLHEVERAHPVGGGAASTRRTKPNRGDFVDKFCRATNEVTPWPIPPLRNRKGSRRAESGPLSTAVPRPRISRSLWLTMGASVDGMAQKPDRSRFDAALPTASRPVRGAETRRGAKSCRMNHTKV